MTLLANNLMVSQTGLATRIRRRLIRLIPLSAWLAAVTLAAYWPAGNRGLGEITGFAEVSTYALNPIESGVIRRVHVQLHSQVEVGQILVEMDDSSDRNRLAVMQVEVNRLQAEIRSEETRLSMDNQRMEVQARDVARQFLGDRESAHVDYLQILVSDSQARAELQGARVELELVQALFQDQYSPFRELNEAQTKVGALQAVIDGNKSLLERAKKRYEDADQRWYNYVEGVGDTSPFDPVLTPLRLAVDEKRLEVEELSRRIDARILRSPISGQVTSLTSHAGDRVMAGAALVGISPTATSRVVAYLPEGRSFDAVLGERVVIRRVGARTGMPVEIAGTVSSLSAIEAEVPVRHRSVSTVPIWGREMVVTLDPGANLLPGEASMVRFVAR